MKQFFVISFILLIMVGSTVKGDPVKTGLLSTVPQYVRYEGSSGAFCIAAEGKAAAVCVSSEDWEGVIRAAGDLVDDIYKVTGTRTRLEEAASPVSQSVIIGTLGKSPLIDRLVAEGKIDVSAIKERWESFLIQTVDGNLVVAGSDKRGTIYGIYDISEKMGVSPWYWWADVPVRKSPSVYVAAGKYVQPSPKVKYRGIFINDEWPSFGGWASARFGGLNSEMYGHLFELLLRLKANYFWPAMWATAFNEDDPANPVLADRYGIIMGTSHHEPMMRAHKEYTRRREEIGAWNYATNKKNLDEFFREGLERNKNFDNLITIGMRGDGDVAMGNGNDEENMEVLYDVIKGQRQIIQDVYGKDPSEVPQLWAIFTEVQRYYDKGFTVPDDVLLLFCDNNWGYIRRGGPLKERQRKGGLGLYYHIDMNGGPWNDRWVNTSPIPKLREQFHLAYESGIDDLWIINVGDLKPKELPVDFILRYAWNPDAIPADKVEEYTREWAGQNFGDEYAEDVADIVSKYAKYNLWRKAEVQVPGIFSVVNYREADRVERLWQDLEEEAEQLRTRIPKEAQDAYFQLVYYPAVASSGIARIYSAVTRNHLYARQGRSSANDYAKLAETLFARDLRLSRYYNDTLADGKWKNMMSDIHIGYTQWSMPEKVELPELRPVNRLGNPVMGVSVEGSEATETEGGLELPVFDALLDQTYYIDLFNRGNGSFDFTAVASQPWVKVSTGRGKVTEEKRIEVGIDWEALVDGTHEACLNIRSGKMDVPVVIRAVKGKVPENDGPYFGNLSGSEFSIPACLYNKNVPARKASWTVLPDLGRGEACMGIVPVTAESTSPGDAPYLEYQVLLPDTGDLSVCLGILPVQDIYPERGLRIAVGLDDEEPQVIDARQGFHDEFKEYTQANLAQSPNLKPLPVQDTSIKLVGKGQPRRNEVFDNQRWLTVKLDVEKAGMHTLKIFMVDPEVVLERIVVNPDNRHPSYFGAPEVRHEANPDPD